MDTQLKDLWVHALRSGDYIQGEQQLRSEGRHCCLGVLCDVFNPNNWQGDEWTFEEGDDESHEIGVLPKYFRMRCGIESKHQDNLIRMNDSGKSFAEIADYIEANL